MEINWFTVVAQVINFLILVWLLKRFLYKPILKAIDERENKIASQLNEAETKKAEAKKEQDEFKQKNETFDQQKKELRSKAIAEIKEEKGKLLEAARTEAIVLSSKLEKELQETHDKLNRRIAQKTQEEVFAISRKTLSDLASLSLEEQSVNVFLKRLYELEEEEKKIFIEAFSSNLNLSAGRQEPVLIRSTFDLPHKQQTEIKHAVKEILGSKARFEFKTTPELISGIELSAKGFKLAWSISAYLNSLEKSISKTVKEKSKAESEKKQDAIK